MEIEKMRKWRRLEEDGGRRRFYFVPPKLLSIEDQLLGK